MTLRSAPYASILMLAIPLLACSDSSPDDGEMIRPVRSQQVLLTGSTHSRTFSGTSKAGTEANLSFRVGGTLLSVNVKVGDRLRKGDVIASVDDSDARLNYDKSLVALEKSRVQKETAKSSLDRIKGLYENNNVSLQDYETAKANYATANAAHDADKTNVDLQKRTLGYFTLYAPIQGIVTAVNVEKNENVTPGQVVAVMNTSDDIEVDVGVPESIISTIDVGGSVTVTFASIPDKTFDGVVSEVAYSINSRSSTYPVTVALSAPTDEIRPGMSADVSFQVGKEGTARPQKIIVPAAAVGEDTRGNFVFVLNPDSGSAYRAERRTITVGALLPEGFEVLSGIRENERVATAGLTSLMDGMKVRLLESQDK